MNNLTLGLLKSCDDYSRIFYPGFDFTQKQNGFAAVNQTVIVGQSYVHHRPYHDLQKKEEGCSTEVLTKLDD